MSNEPDKPKKWTWEEWFNSDETYDRGCPNLAFEANEPYLNHLEQELLFLREKNKHLKKDNRQLMAKLKNAAFTRSGVTWASYDAVKEENLKLQEENKLLKQDVRLVVKDMEYIRNLEAQNKILMEAVEFYAEAGHWGTDLPGQMTSSDPVDHEAFEYYKGAPHKSIRGGKLARQALDQIEKVREYKEHYVNQSMVREFNDD